MCHQSVGLIQSIIEKAVIPTVSITLCREITERVAPPRALFVDFPCGYPLGAPNDPARQTRITRASFALLTKTVPPVIVRDLAVRIARTRICRTALSNYEKGVYCLLTEKTTRPLGTVTEGEDVLQILW